MGYELLVKNWLGGGIFSLPFALMQKVSKIKFPILAFTLALVCFFFNFCLDAKVTKNQAPILASKNFACTLNSQD
jgi:hypothetical protein